MPSSAAAEAKGVAAVALHRLNAHIEDTVAMATTTANNALELLDNSTNISTSISLFNIYAAKQKANELGNSTGNALELPMRYTNINRLPFWFLKLLAQLGSMEREIEWLCSAHATNAKTFVGLDHRHVFHSNAHSLTLRKQ